MKTFADVEARLAETLPGYTPRPQQQELARSVETTLEQQGSKAMLEAGTGVGKSLAGLIPAILAGKRTVFATATKALQQQVVDKDLPFLQEQMGLDFTWALLKGRSNFACHAQMSSPDAWSRDVDQEQVNALFEAYDADPEHMGDYESSNASIVAAGLDGLSEKQFSRLTISGDDCPGAKVCPFGTVCLSEKARKRAKEAQVVVANTALLLADSAVSQATGGAASMLGDYDVQIVDEAHTLQETATEAFASAMRPGTFTALANEVGSLLHAADEKADYTEDLGSVAAALFALLPDPARKGTYTDTSPVRLRRSWFVEQFDAVEKLVTTLREVGEELAMVRPAGDLKVQARKAKLTRRIRKLTDALRMMCLDEDFVTVRYVEFEERGRGRDARVIKVLKSAPVDVAQTLADALWNRSDTTENDRVSTVLMSATLSTGKQGDFSFLAGALGMTDAANLSVGTPFDYPTQALTYLPPADAPSPKDRGAWMTYTQATIDRLVRAADGGALLLFTSRSAMTKAYEALAGRFEDAGYNCFMQGMPGMSNQQISDAFRNDTDSVLFALRSFYAGVDFSGDTCRLVVMDKLTFPVPSDPIFSARSELCEARGGKGFSDLSIPMMTLTLTQGFGRLIRSHEDRGVVAILDSRLTSAYWGQKIARNLPPAPQTSDFGMVEQFYRGTTR